MSDPDITSAVEITVPELVALRQNSQVFQFKPGNVLSQQGGDYQSHFKGRGMEFSESRPYEPGDDIRNLDWRVMARTGRAHTKLFREERERPVFFSVDYRGPMFFATRGMYKSVMAARLASLLAWSACKHNDRVGGLIFSNNIHIEIKPRRGKSGVLRLIQSLVEHSSGNSINLSNQTESNVNDVILRLRRIVRPGSLIYFLSDFRDFSDSNINQILQLGRHNDVVLLSIVDPLERALPGSGRYRISDGRVDMTLDTYDKNFTESYKQRFIKREQKIEDMANRGRMKLLKILTTDNPVSKLNNAFAFRTQ